MAPTDSDELKESGVKRKLDVTEETNRSPRKRKRRNNESGSCLEFIFPDTPSSKGQDHSSPSGYTELTPSSIGSKSPNTGSADVETNGSRRKTERSNDYGSCSQLIFPDMPPSKGQDDSSCQGNDSKELSKDLSKSNGDVMIHVDLDIKNGEYHLKLSNVRTSTEIDSAEKLAHNGAMLLFQAEMLRKLGEQLLSQFQASFQSIIKN